MDTSIRTIYTKPIYILCRKCDCTIEELYNGYQASLKEQQEQASIQDQITNLELAIAELYETQQGGTN